MNPTRRLFCGLIRFYQLAISPILPGGCRFVPSCSDYAREAVIRHGVMKGLWLAARRLLRCHPWGGHGHDPVPQDGPLPPSAIERATTQERS